MKCCFYCGKPIEHKPYYILMDAWNYCSWFHALLDCLESGHSVDEVMKWHNKKELVFHE